MYFSNVCPHASGPSPPAERLMPGIDGDYVEDRLSGALVHPLPGGFPPPGCPLPHCLHVGSADHLDPAEAGLLRVWRSLAPRGGRSVQVDRQAVASE